MSQPDREQQVGAAFVALADTLVDDYDVIDLLDELVGRSVELLSVTAAGLLLSDADGALRSVASSSEDAEMMELLQVRAGEGPFLEAWQSVAQVRVPDLMQAAHRWPKFVSTAAAREMPFAAVHSIPLRLRGQAIGALNLFNRASGVLTESDLALAQALADVATIGILQQRAIRQGEVLAEQLQTALNSRVIIEQAKGVIAQSLGIGTEAAFLLLRQCARSTNERLAVLARRVVERDVDPAALGGSAAPGRPGAPSDGDGTRDVGIPVDQHGSLG